MQMKVFLYPNQIIGKFKVTELNYSCKSKMVEESCKVLCRNSNAGSKRVQICAV